MLGARKLAAALAAVAALACSDFDRPAGDIEGDRRPSVAVDAGERAQVGTGRSLGVPSEAPQRILFGDLHVHTTFSIDAFLYQLPLFGGEGAHPPADACDFARHCSSLDFFSLNDHAEGLTPELWSKIKESMRQCNARAGDPADPDMVAFTGWEWTQVGATPEDHYGHKNVMFRGLADDELPARPINSMPTGTRDRARGMGVVGALKQLRPLGLGRYADFLHWIQQMGTTPECETGVDTRELPDDCMENAPTPRDLFEKLDQWGFESLVIPHGLAWGIHSPRGSRLDNQLNRAQHDPRRQRLIEVFSGHGNGEEYRARLDQPADPELACPEPTPDFLPCCWRAGELMRARCGDLPAEECQARVEEARRLAWAAGPSAQRVMPGVPTAEWLDCDQCRDCFKPARDLRSGETAQYSLAISNFDASGGDADPLRFRWGFIGSSDIHNARAGTGYKQVDRRAMSDSRGLRSERVESLLRGWVIGRQEDPQRPQAVPPEERGFRSLFDVERTASYLYTGGLVAVHARGRNRDSIWEALAERRVYGTSGPRILLWFELVNGPQGPAIMGSEVELRDAPRFRVRAAGSFVQKPGCPPESREALSAERLELLCRGECYHPSDERHPIEAIEVIRVRPQVVPGEAVAPLIEDPWLRFECPPDPSGGCVFEFEDPDYTPSGRDAAYYVRALQRETPAINGGGARVDFDASGRGLKARPCFGGWRTSSDDDCLTPVQERAWSSPIFLDQPSG